MIMAVVFNIQRFSVHDGPGIRTTVFLKGCNLRCRWCHNPESIAPSPQIQYFAERCTGCNMCSQACKKGIRVECGRRETEASCMQCGRCTEYCMNDAIKKTGVEMSPQQVLEIVVRDKEYYENSGGGMTLSGGEPLLQAEFCAQLLQLAKAQGIDTAVDTAGNVPYKAFEAILPYTDKILLDLKIMDDTLHRKYTGASNKLILENARKLFKEDVELYIRMPVVVGANDTLENARATAEFLSGAKNVREIKLLAYHNMAEDKAKSVARTHEVFDVPDETKLKELAAQFSGRAIW